MAKSNSLDRLNSVLAKSPSSKGTSKQLDLLDGVVKGTADVPRANTTFNPNITYTDNTSTYDTEFVEGLSKSRDTARAHTQSEGLKALNAVVGGAIGGTLMFAEEVGYLGDFESHYERLNDTATDVDNWLSKWARETKQETVYKDWMPIYQTEGKGLADKVFKWENLRSVTESAVGFGGVGIGAGALVKGVGALSKMTRVGTFVEAFLGKVGTARLGTAAAGTITNVAEGLQLGMETYETSLKQYESFVIKGDMTENEAKMRAAQDADRIVTYNLALAGLDMMGMDAIFKAGASRELFTKPTLGAIAKSQLYQAPKEGLEEMGQKGLQGEASYQGLKELSESTKDGKKRFSGDNAITLSDPENFLERLTEYSTTEDALLEGIMGFFGGPMQYTITQAPFRNTKAEMQTYIDQQEQLKKNAIVVKNLFKAAKDSGELMTAAQGDEALQNIVADKAIRNNIYKAMATGTLTSLEESIEARREENPKLADNLLKTIAKAEQIYNKTSGYLNRGQIFALNYDIQNQQALYNKTVVDQNDALKEVKAKAEVLSSTGKFKSYDKRVNDTDAVLTPIIFSSEMLQDEFVYDSSNNLSEYYDATNRKRIGEYVEALKNTEAYKNYKSLDNVKVDIANSIVNLEAKLSDSKSINTQMDLYKAQDKAIKEEAAAKTINSIEDVATLNELSKKFPNLKDKVNVQLAVLKERGKSTKTAQEKATKQAKDEVKEFDNTDKIDKQAIANKIHDNGLQSLTDKEVAQYDLYKDAINKLVDNAKSVQKEADESGVTVSNELPKAKAKEIANKLDKGEKLGVADGFIYKKNKEAVDAQLTKNQTKPAPVATEAPLYDPLTDINAFLDGSDPFAIKVLENAGYDTFDKLADLISQAKGEVYLKDNWVDIETAYKTAHPEYEKQSYSKFRNIKESPSKINKDLYKQDETPDTKESIEERTNKELSKNSKASRNNSYGMTKTGHDIVAYRNRSFEDTQKGSNVVRSEDVDSEINQVEILNPTKLKPGSKVKYVVLHNYEGDIIHPATGELISWEEYKKEVDGDVEAYNSVVPIKVTQNGEDLGYLHDTTWINDNSVAPDQDSPSLDEQQDLLTETRNRIINNGGELDGNVVDIIYTGFNKSPDGNRPISKVLEGIEDKVSIVVNEFGGVDMSYEDKTPMIVPIARPSINSEVANTIIEILRSYSTDAKNDIATELYNSNAIDITSNAGIFEALNNLVYVKNVTDQEELNDYLVSKVGQSIAIGQSGFGIHIAVSTVKVVDGVNENVISKEYTISKKTPVDKLDSILKGIAYELTNNHTTHNFNMDSFKHKKPISLVNENGEVVSKGTYNTYMMNTLESPYQFMKFENDRVSAIIQPIIKLDFDNGKLNTETKVVENKDEINLDELDKDLGFLNLDSEYDDIGGYESMSYESFDDFTQSKEVSKACKK